jgi:hypothetical protein
MAPDTEPTDEELQVVMGEALVSAMARKKEAERLIEQLLLEAVATLNVQRVAES